MYQDLREFITLVDKLGALRRIEGADPKFELGGITEVAAGLPDAPALLFERFSRMQPRHRRVRRWHSASIPRCGPSTRSRNG
jgi:3-polyprenyl-4-hydroxybenzoate decarboxylase